MTIAVSIGIVNVDFIIDFNRKDQSFAQLPEWINQPEAIKEDFYNKMLTVLNYKFRVTDADKWYFDQQFKNHQRMHLQDDVSKITGQVYITKLEADWTSNNWERPWVVTLTLFVSSLNPVPTYKTYSLDCVVLLCCPTGEQIINGGFDTGDFTGWEAVGPPQITDYDFPHSDPYHLSMTLNYSSIKQTFSAPIPVRCITSFSLWKKCVFASGEGPIITMTFTYSDNTTDIFNLPATTKYIYEEVNLLPFLNASKSLKSIYIISSSVDFYEYVFIDDVSLRCD